MVITIAHVAANEASLLDDSSELGQVSHIRSLIGIMRLYTTLSATKIFLCISASAQGSSCIILDSDSIVKQQIKITLPMLPSCLQAYVASVCVCMFMFLLYG